MSPQPSRTSGEHRLPEGASSDVRVLAAAVEMGQRTIDLRFDGLAGKIDGAAQRINERLDAGAATMNRMEETITTLTTSVSEHSEAIARLQPKGPDRTPRASPALAPIQPATDRDKRLPWWARDVVRAIITVIVTGSVVLLLEHGKDIARAFTGGGH